MLIFLKLYIFFHAVLVPRWTSLNIIYIFMYFCFMRPVDIKSSTVKMSGVCDETKITMYYLKVIHYNNLRVQGTTITSAYRAQQ